MIDEWSLFNNQRKQNIRIRFFQRCRLINHKAIFLSCKSKLANARSSRLPDFRFPKPNMPREECVTGILDLRFAELRITSMNSAWDWESSDDTLEVWSVQDDSVKVDFGVRYGASKFKFMLNDSWLDISSVEFGLILGQRMLPMTAEHKLRFNSQRKLDYLHRQQILRQQMIIYYELR
jgi:hypothetical protein